jgi:hypothetical protein
MVTALLAGLAVGAAHAVTGPDHLAAVVPLSLDTPWRGARTGLAWGTGHGTGVALLALVALALREVFLVELVGAWSELAVGALLVVIGGWAIRRARPSRAVHVHLRPAFGVGTLHGSAGASHLVGLVPAMGLPLGSAVAYLLAFLVGAAAAMTAVGMLCGAASHHVGPRGRSSLHAFAGVAAVAVGIAWMIGAAVHLA